MIFTNKFRRCMLRVLLYAVTGENCVNVAWRKTLYLVQPRMNQAYFISLEYLYIAMQCIVAFS